MSTPELQEIMEDSFYGQPVRDEALAMLQPLKGRKLNEVRYMLKYMSRVVDVAAIMPEDISGSLPGSLKD